MNIWHHPIAGVLRLTAISVVVVGVVCLPAGLTTGCLGPQAVVIAATPPQAVTAGYMLCPGDEIGVDVFREPNLSGVFQLDSAGCIRHPIFGTVEVSGITAEEAEARITALLAERYLMNPRVMIRVVTSQSSQIVILGEVRKPGVYTIDMDKPVTLLQAVAEAGGFTDLARINRIRIVRGTDGRQRKIRVQSARIIDGREPDIRLEPNDVIMVPQTVF